MVICDLWVGKKRSGVGAPLLVYFWFFQYVSNSSISSLLNVPADVVEPALQHSYFPFSMAVTFIWSCVLTLTTKAPTGMSPSDILGDSFCCCCFS